jgi:hypothetical protein
MQTVLHRYGFKDAPNLGTAIKRASGYTYIFAVAMRPGNTNATFILRGFTGNPAVEVVGESRNLSSTTGVFQDSFTSHGIHIN